MFSNILLKTYLLTKTVAEDYFGVFHKFSYNIHKFSNLLLEIYITKTLAEDYFGVFHTFSYNIHKFSYIFTKT